MHYYYVKVKELTKFSTSHSNLEGYYLAITHWRAESQENNPYADPDDIALILAQDENGQICGFIGALPCRMKMNYKEKYAWFSGWWVSPSAVKGTAGELLIRFNSVYNNKIMFSDMPSLRLAEKIHQTAGGIVKVRNGYHFWLRSDITRKLLSRNKKGGRYLNTLYKSGLIFAFKIPDTLLNLVIVPFQLLASIHIDKSDLNIIKIKDPGDDDFKFMQDCAGKDIFTPRSEDLKWYNCFPWLVREDRQNKIIASKYYFSSFAGNNELFWLKICKAGQTTGLIMISLRDGTAKTQFVYISSGMEDLVVRKTMVYILRKYTIKDMITFNEKFIHPLTKLWFPYLRLKKKNRYYGVSHELVKNTGEDFTMQDGSGDYVFT